MQIRICYNCSQRHLREGRAAWNPTTSFNSGPTLACTLP
jgi:hypothetical protein